MLFELELLISPVASRATTVLSIALLVIIYSLEVLVYLSTDSIRFSIRSKSWCWAGRHANSGGYVILSWLIELV